MPAATTQQSPRAIQDAYPDRFAHCHGCGTQNPDGLHLQSFVDGDETVLHYSPDPVFSGGVPDHVYGGMIASLLDCHGTASAFAFAAREQPDREPSRYVTGTLTVKFVAPTPMGTELTVRGRLREISGRKVIVGLELSAEGRVCAEGEMIAIQMPSAS